MDFNRLNIAINNAILELNQRGTFNSVTELPEVWQQVINKGGDYLLLSFYRINLSCIL
jgi:hypothetical protein